MPARHTLRRAGELSIEDDGYHLGQILAYCPMKPEKKELALQIIDEEAQKLATLRQRDARQGEDTHAQAN